MEPKKVNNNNTTTTTNNNNNNNDNGKEVTIQESMCRDTTNVEPEMYDCASNNWIHWNSNEKFKKKFGSGTRKTFDRFTTKDSST